MKAETIDSSLHPRIWTFNRQTAERQFVLLTDGTGEADMESHRLAIAAPAIAWLGDLKPGRFRIEAGATGYRGWTGADVLMSAIGEQSDSIALTQLADRNFVLSLAGQGEHAARAEHCLAASIAELRHPQAASPLMLSAYLRMLLVTLLRLSGGGQIEPTGPGGTASLLARFRQLVEMNFRSHWTITQYADALNITPDRLHSICSRAVGKPPKALVSERLANEAMVRLERSALSVEQLGLSLGFSDPAHFSSFFRRMAGMPPGTYRRMRQQAQRGAQLVPSFADWP